MALTEGRPAGTRFGWWAAVAAAAASIGYGIPQLMQVAGLLPDPIDRILIFAPSLVLAPCFAVAIAAVHVVTPTARAAWSLSGLTLAIMYAVMVQIVYVTQLGVVIPHDLAGADVEMFACCAQGHFATGVDLLGYTLMSVSTFFTAFAFPSHGRGRTARLWFVLNGALAPFLILQLAFPWLIWIGALWLITFPGAMIALARLFGAPPERLAQPQ